MNKKAIQLLTLFLAITAVSLSLFSVVSKKKIRWFNYNKVYSQSQLKKNLEKDLEQIVSNRSSELDSIRMEISFLSHKVKSGKSTDDELDLFEELKNRYLTLQNNYERENVKLKEMYFTQIREEINLRSKEFAIEFKIDYLFSAVGDGALMFASEEEEVTQEVLKFINQ